MEKKEYVKCPRCGFENIKGTKKCSKCKKDIDSIRKSCPKCGKINANNVKRCGNCKYDFAKKKRSIWFNLLISILIIGILCLLVYLDKEGLVKKFSLALKVLAGFSVFVIFIKFLTYGKNDIINYTAEDEILDNQKSLNIMRRWSNIAIIMGGLLVLGFLIYYYFIR